MINMSSLKMSIPFRAFFNFNGFCVILADSSLPVGSWCLKKRLKAKNILSNTKCVVLVKPGCNVYFISHTLKNRAFAVASEE